ncbi:hypothetical protein [Schlesneria paludicola]|uniref:hypothetical protein n=1 Tax=Schlesneria paludicola TaxID=360056 RepID=UPI0012F70FDE|nr:hypothetical protein [Schlesneria paludicola]
MSFFTRISLVVPFWIVSVTVAAEGASRVKPLNIGAEKVLFVDPQFLANSEGVRLTLHAPRKTGEHLVVSEHPWENATLGWFSVLKEGDKFRMWYECYDVSGWPTDDDTSFCYAESDDGIHWTKPKLGMFSYQGRTDNNILFRMIGEGKSRSRVHGNGVFLDPTAPPERRYKCVSQGLFQGIGNRPYYVAGMTSPDGLKWTRQPEPICPVFADSQYSGFWDPAQQKYLLFGRVGGRGRALGRSISGQWGQFSALSLVLQTDENHPSDSDLYNPACIAYPGGSRLYLMLPSLYQHKPDTLDIQLAVSRDTEHWTWPDRETPLIPLGKRGEFDSGSLYAANGCVEVGDELWFYYSGSPLKHEEANLEQLAIPANRRIFSRAIAQRDRLVSVTADAGRGIVQTPLIQFRGGLLIVNAVTRAGGMVRVGLLDADGTPIPGHGIEDCRVLMGDRPAATVSWTDGSDVSKWSERPIRLQFELQDADLYGFVFKNP